MKQLLWYLLAGTRGGGTRARIIHSLIRKPKNAHQLAKTLKLDYKTVQHHLNILIENRILTPVGKRYGAAYFPSEELKSIMPTFWEIWKQFGNKSGKD